VSTGADAASRPLEDAAAARGRPRRAPPSDSWAAAGRWPLAAAIVAAAALRLPTIGMQSLWYDEAFTPVHVLHPGLGATLAAVAHYENTPPLWYVGIWGWTRVFGSGAVALRLPSPVAGILTVPVAWAIGRELMAGAASARRVATAAAWIVAVDPLFVWYSQEGRAYALFVLIASLALLCFLRAQSAATPRSLAAFAISASLALLTHYFAIFLVVPMALWLLRRCRGVRGALAAAALPAAVGAALVPLIAEQAGHGTQWIAAWSLPSRLAAIPQYFLTGYSGAPLGHSIELLVAVAIAGGVLLGLWRTLGVRERDGALLALALAACGVLIPLLAALLDADYLAPRNLVAAMVPLSVAIAVLVAAERTARAGLLSLLVILAALAAVTVDVDFNARLQRADWHALAQALAHPLRGAGPAPARAITTVELGSAPLEYYLPPLHNLRSGARVRVSEIDETGYVPLRPAATEAPAPGFRLRERVEVHGMVAMRWTSRTPRTVTEARLRSHVITAARAEVLVPGGGARTVGAP
jgi:mannosyltransferase